MDQKVRYEPPRFPETGLSLATSTRLSYMTPMLPILELVVYVTNMKISRTMKMITALHHAEFIQQTQQDILTGVALGTRSNVKQQRCMRTLYANT